MIRQLSIALPVIAAGLVATPGNAASCADRDLVVKKLKAQYDEVFSAGGLQQISNKQTLVEVWSSHETGTFTVMLTSPEGLSCVVATGTNWHQVDTKDLQQESQS